MRRLLVVLGPGLLIAATGVGAGDLATAGFAGAQLGTTVLWAIAFGAFLKFVLTEGLARWQLATGTTLLEGVAHRLARGFIVAFLLYLIPWSFFVGGALISATGVATHAMLPVFEDAQIGKLVYGSVGSAIAVALALFGGFALFERVMATCIVVMVAAVITTAALLRPDLGDVVTGLLVPRMAAPGTDGFGWTVGLLGGVGGTVTLLCYGYWIRDAGRTDATALRTCRIDLGVGYAMTALFGFAMVCIAARLGDVSGRGTALIVALADQLAEPLGPAGRWIFLIGAWAAIVSSLLGVWQAVPLIFGDTWRLLRGRPTPPTMRDTPVRLFLVALAVIPILQAARPFATAQKYYAVMGAAFLPLLALALLLLNTHERWIGSRQRNRIGATLVLVATLIVFVTWGVLDVLRRFA